MEQQIKKHQTGEEVVAGEDPFSGGIDLSQIDPTALMNLLNTSRAQAGSPVISPSYEQSFDKYLERLKPYTYQAPRMNIYDVASELGAAILATPATGNTFEGVGRGFSGVSSRIRQNQEDNQKLNQQVAMQAASMAMQDERSANEYLQKYSMERLKLANDPGDIVEIEFDEIIPQLDENQQPVLDDAGVQVMVPTGRRMTGSFRDNPDGRAIIDRLLKEQNGRDITASGNQTRINLGESGDKEYVKAMIKNEDKIFADAKAASGVVDQVNYARSVAQRLGRDGYGSVEGFLLPIKKVLLGAGLGGMINESKLGDQVLMNQIGISFAMAIVAQTKGAISNREMEMFLGASPVLTSTYDGFMKQLDYLERIAARSEQYALDYSTKFDELEDLELSASKTKREMDRFGASWRRENPLFEADEFENISALSRGEAKALNEGGYTLSKDFDYQKSRQVYRDIQANKESGVPATRPSVTQNSIDEGSSNLAKRISEDSSMTLLQKQEQLQNMVNGGLIIPDFYMINFQLTAPESNG